jgi:phycocyanobilin lyase subunit beta
MKWHWFPADLREIAQAEALEALLFVTQQDEEWVVRYAGVVGLQSLAIAVGTTQSAWRSQIQTQLQQMADSDNSWAVKARAALAIQQLQTGRLEPIEDQQPASLQTVDWQVILDKLYERKGEERLSIAEGDPRRYRELAVAIGQKTVEV